jgi:hypothetical protein
MIEKLTIKFHNSLHVYFITISAVDSLMNGYFFTLHLRGAKFN